MIVWISVRESRAATVAYLFQSDDLKAGDIRVGLRHRAQGLDEELQTVLVLHQEGGCVLVVLPQDQLHEQGLCPLERWVSPARSAPAGSPELALEQAA